MDNKSESKVTPEIVQKIEHFLEERKTKLDRRDLEAEAEAEAERRSGTDRRGIS